MVTQITGSTLILLGLIISISAGMLLAIVVYLIRARRQVERSNQQAEWNLKFSSSLASSEVIANIHAELVEMFPTATPHIYALNADPESAARLRSPAVDIDTAAAWVQNNNRPLILTGDVIQQAAVQGLRLTAPMHGLIGLPLNYANERVGVIVLVVPETTPALTTRQADQWLYWLNRLCRSAAPALRNALIYSEASQMADQLAFFSRSSFMVTSNLDIQSTLGTIAHLAAETVRADYVGIFLTREDRRTVSLVYSTGLSEEYVALFQDVPLTPDGPFAMSNALRPITIPNVHTDPAGMGWRTLSALADYTSLAIIPLATKDLNLGFLVVYYRLEHSFDRYKVDTLTVLSGQLSVTLANTQLYQSEQKRAQQMLRLANASRVFTSSLDLGNVTSKVLDELYDVLLPDKCVVMLEGTDGVMRITAQRNFMNTDSLAQIAQVPGIALAIDTGKTAILPQHTDDLELLQRIGVESLYVAPLISQGKPIGLTLLAYEKKRVLTPDEEQLAEALVNQAAVAIRNAQLFAQVDEALDERILELSAIEKISRKISGLLNLDEIIADVLDTALDVTDAAVATAALVTGTDPEYFTMIEHYAQREGIKPSRGVIRRDQGVIGQVFRTGNIAWIGDIRKHPEYHSVGMKGMLSELCVPIMHQGNCIGAINVESRRLNAFDISHRRFLVTLADHAAIALANARLFDDRQQQIDNLQTLRRFSLELLSATSLRDVMRMIVQSTIFLMRAKDVHLYLYDMNSDVLTFGWSIYDDGREGVEATAPSPDGRSYNVARSGGMQFIADMRRFQSPDDFRDGVGYRAVARVALKRGERVIGLLVITFRDAQFFEETPTRTLELVTNQAAIALENTMLFEEVRSARDAMQAILDNTREGMILLGESGDLLLTNPAVERLAGYPLRHFVGRNLLRRLMSLRGKADAVTVKFLTDGLRDLIAILRVKPYDVHRYEFTLPGTEQPRDLLMTIFPILNNADRIQGRLVVVRDISEEKATERLRDELIELVVHDLRAPMGVVVTAMNLLIELVRSEDYNEVMHTAEIANNAARFQMNMIQELLDMEKMADLKRTHGSLHQMAADATALLNTTAEEAGIEIRNLIPLDLPPLKFDQPKIARVFNNLIDNAIRHTPENGEIRLEAWTLPGHGGTPYVQINVTDTGKGVPEMLREKVFEKLYQVTKSSMRGKGSAGLGLTFCKRMIEAHGGRIWVDSGPEGGAAFCFTLPAETVELPPGNGGGTLYTNGTGALTLPDGLRGNNDNKGNDNTGNGIGNGAADGINGVTNNPMGSATDSATLRHGTQPLRMLNSGRLGTSERPGV